LGAYEATHRALEIARQIPAARCVAKRWESDLRDWSDYARRAEHQIPRFAKRHDAIRAAKLLDRWSRAQEQLQFDETLDDPMVMAELEAEGMCVIGTVTKLDLDNREVKPGNKRATQVPLLTLKLEAPTRLLKGMNVLWSGDTSVSGEIRTVDERSSMVALVSGHNHGERIPAKGSTALFASISTFGGNSPRDPESVPWTHRPEDSSDEVSPPPPAEIAEDGTPDLSLDELADTAPVGPVTPDDVPEVLI